VADRRPRALRADRLRDAAERERRQTLVTPLDRLRDLLTKRPRLSR
jgi:hypothetical protein